jgi:hypothetical protein
MVERIVFDPHNYLLKTATVLQKMPEGKPFRYGPNPVTNKLTIQFPNNALIDAVRITNFAGQEIYNARDAENPLTLDLSSYADGAYVIELTNASETYQERIVKISAN